MNTLTIIVLLILAVFALNGYSRGLVKTLTNMFFFVLTAVLVYYATPYVSSFLKTQTPVYRMAERKCEDLAENLISSGTGTGEDVPRAGQSELIKSLPLPDSLKTQLIDNNNSFSYESLAAETFTQYIAGYMASLLLNILVYVITFFLVNLLLRMTVMTLDVITDLPVLHGINQFFGLVLGLLQGVAVIWIGFLVLTVLVHTDFGTKLMAMVNESAVLSMLYNSNIFLRYLFRL